MKLTLAEPRSRLAEQVVRFNAGAKRPDDPVGIFQMPLERIV
jgi:hypothetical protein